MSARLRLRVLMEDGTEQEVTSDQRDYASWEMQPFHGEDRRVTATRYFAYAALTRTKQTTLSWPRWNAAAVQVEAVDGEVTVDPTSPDHSAAD
jgi:hypothetical protein